MAKVKIRLNNIKTDEHEEIEGIFDDHEISKLRPFVRAVRRVRECTLLQRGLPAITKMKFDQGAFKIECPPCSDSELHELLHVLRPVMLHREIASFDNIAALLMRCFSDRKFSDYIKAVRRNFEDGELAGYMQILVGNQSLFDSSLLDNYLNGTQYHTDQEKADAWTALERSLTADNARAVVINQLHSRVKSLFYLEAVVELVLDRAGSATPLLSVNDAQGGKA